MSRHLDSLVFALVGSASSPLLAQVGFSLESVSPSVDGDGDERSSIVRCRFTGGLDDKAISIEAPGRHGEPRVARNILTSCGTGIAIEDGARVSDGHHNTIVSCRIGLDLFAKDEASDGGHADVHSTILWNNLTNLALDELSTLTIDHSNVGAASSALEAWPGEGNLSADPRFVDAVVSNSALRPESPCIDAGREGSDIGAVEFDGTPAVVFLRGDANESGRVDISDAIKTLGFLFLGEPAPSCHDRMYSDDDGQLNLTDAVTILNFLFFGG